MISNIGTTTAVMLGVELTLSEEKHNYLLKYFYRIMFDITLHYVCLSKQNYYVSIKRSKY